VPIWGIALTTSALTATLSCTPTHLDPLPRARTVSPHRAWRPWCPFGLAANERVDFLSIATWDEVCKEFPDS
jgi:hypothetical protein